MSVRVVIDFTNQEAAAVLRSEGLTNGYGVRKSIALERAQMRLIAALAAATQTAEEER